MTQELLTIPHFMQLLGLVTAIAMFVSPVMYNGDYKKPVRAIFVLLCCGFISSIIIANSNIQSKEDCIAILFATNLAFVFGLYIGVFIHNLIFYKR
ncbi:MAG: hypothetical protein WC108_05415 [Bacteroidales bacterium]|jgi:hypothetical protein